MNSFKPYDLVHVFENLPTPGAGRYSYVGQVISMPMPDDQILIRRIPNDANSTVVANVSQLSLTRQTGMRPYQYVHWATVAGPGSFPSDMLRFDQCVPANFEVITGIAVVHAEKVKAYGTELTVACVSASHEPPWTVERWSSFLWGIPSSQNGDTMTHPVNMQEMAQTFGFSVDVFEEKILQVHRILSGVNPMIIFSLSVALLKTSTAPLPPAMSKIIIESAISQLKTMLPRDAAG